MRKLTPLLTAFLVAAGLFAPPAGAQPIEKPNVTISIGTWVIQYLPLPAALAKGFFRDEGVNVTLQNFEAGGSKALQSLLGGSSDLVVGFYDHTVQMQAQHKDVRCVILLNVVPGLVLAVRKDLAGQVHGVADLKGRRVGVTAPGSSTEFQLRFLAQRAGLAPSDLTFIGVGSGPTAVAAIERKSVDAIMTQDPTFAVMEKRGLVGALVDARTVAGSTTAFGGKYPTACLYTTQDFIEHNPGTVQHLVNGFARSLRWISDSSPEEIAHALPREYALGDTDTFVDVLRETKAMFPANGRFDPADLMRAHQVLSTLDEKVAKANFVVDDTYTNRFVDAVPAPSR